MELFYDPREISVRYGRYIDDLRRLFVFHGLSCGAPRHLGGLANKLEASKPLRADLSGLIRSTRDLEPQLTADDMLAVLVVSISGDITAVDPALSPLTTRSILLLQLLLSGIGGWSEPNSDGYAANLAEHSALNPPELPGDPHPQELTSATQLVDRRTPNAVPTDQPNSGVDVRAFVRSAELPSLPLRLRREPLSEIVRPSPAAVVASPQERLDLSASHHDSQPVPLAESGSGLVQPPAAPIEARPEPQPSPAMEQRLEQALQGLTLQLQQMDRRIAELEPRRGAHLPPPARQYLGPRASAPQPEQEFPVEPRPQPPDVPPVSLAANAVESSPSTFVGSAARTVAPENPGVPSPSAAPGPAMPMAMLGELGANRTGAGEGAVASSVPNPVPAPEAQADEEPILSSPGRARFSYAASAVIQAGAADEPEEPTPATHVPETASAAPRHATRPQPSSDLRSEGVAAAPRRQLTTFSTVAALLLLAIAGFAYLHHRSSAKPVSLHATSDSEVLHTKPPAPPQSTTPSPQEVATANPEAPAVDQPGSSAPTVSERTEATAPAPDAPPTAKLPSRSPHVSRTEHPEAGGRATSTSSTPAAATSPDTPSASPQRPLPVPESTMDQHIVAARKPVYPPAALDEHLEGTVVLNAVVDTDGSVRRVDVVNGPPTLINSAIAAATWRRYRPFLLHGRPVEVATRITLNYHLP